MKRALLVTLCGALSACWAFDDEVEKLCAAGKLTCPVDAGEPAGPDGGPDDDAGVTDAGEVDSGIPDAGNSDGGTPDAGGSDSGTPDAGDLDDGGQRPLCKGGWCWENPWPTGALRFASIWGNADDDFWVGGAGGIVLHFDGQVWRTEGVSDSLSWDTSVRYGFVTPAGDNWMCPSTTPPMRLDGGVFPGWSVGPCGGADWWNGESYFVSSAGNGPVSRSPSGQLSPITEGDEPYARDTIGAGSNAIAVAERGNNGNTIGWYTDGNPPESHRAPLINAADGGTLEWIQAFGRGPNDELYAIANRNEVVCLGALVDGGWVFQPLPSSVPVLYDFGYSADGGWWFVGGNGYFAAGVSDPFQLTAQPSPTYQSMLAGWRSPSGTVWSVGTEGLVARNGQPLTSDVQGPVFDVLADDPAIAVGGSPGASGRVWRRDGGTWTFASESTNAIIAVARHRDGGLVTFNYSGEAFNGATQLTLGSVSTARAAMAVDTDDVIWLATPDRVHAWSSAQPEAISPPSGMEFSDLAAGPDGGVFVSLRATNGTAAGGLAFILATPDAGLSWLVQDLSMTAVASVGDTVVVAGPTSVQRCTPACAPLGLAPGGSPLSLVALSIDDVWLMQNNGVTFHWNGSTWEQRSPPINEFFYVSRMRASRDGKTLYIVGDDGAILRRSLP